LTNLCVVPYRNPYLLAKAALTLDVVSAGRLTSVRRRLSRGRVRRPGQQFGDRNERFDAAITAMRAATGGGERSPESGRAHTMLPVSAVARSPI
jgi:alkanesulfonate monooxygenase SsuD/methylene tetrahydromethanopterin reductase-like flavin-dependent oxidoreductase (luciferase family)